ncbi:MAG: methyltransferase domain-containing protein [Polyangiaceae bacterium]|nr:methyltransferase domain-containing protein [Polyangiaceae bacterium]
MQRWPMDLRTLEAIVRGLATHIPRPRKSGGSTALPRYCYTVWGRHLITLRKMGCTLTDAKVLELGPGHSLGSSLCALFTLAREAHGLDLFAVRQPGAENRMLPELSAMFQRREDLPGRNEFPKAKPYLEDLALPDGEPIRNVDRADLESRLRYHVEEIHTFGDDGSFDLIFSQATLQHIEDVEGYFRAFARLLTRGGWMSHQIDFSCFETAKRWNGHWLYPGPLWRVMRGNYCLTNRRPLSHYLELGDRFGFRLVGTLPTLDRTGYPYEARRAWCQDFTQADFETSGAMLVWQKE